MIDILRLLGGRLAGLFVSQATREAEMAFLRQQLFVFQIALEGKTAHLDFRR